MIWFRSRVFVVPGTPITIRSSIPAREASGSAEERGCRRVVVLARTEHPDQHTTLTSLYSI